jgi:hypothetical protein
MQQITDKLDAFFSHPFWQIPIVKQQTDFFWFWAKYLFLDLFPFLLWAIPLVLFWHWINKSPEEEKQMRELTACLKDATARMEKAIEEDKNYRTID